MKQSTSGRGCQLLSCTASFVVFDELSKKHLDGTALEQRDIHDGNLVSAPAAAWSGARQFSAEFH